MLVCLLGGQDGQSIRMVYQLLMEEYMLYQDLGCIIREDMCYNREQ